MLVCDEQSNTCVLECVCGEQSNTCLLVYDERSNACVLVCVCVCVCGEQSNTCVLGCVCDKPSNTCVSVCAMRTKEEVRMLLEHGWDSKVIVMMTQLIHMQDAVILRLLGELPEPCVKGDVDVFESK